MNHSRTSPLPALDHSFRVPQTFSRETPTTSSTNRPSSAMSHQRIVTDRAYDRNPPMCAYVQQLRKNRWFHTQQRPASAMRIGQPLFDTAPQPLDSKVKRKILLLSSQSSHNSNAMTGANLHRHRQVLQDLREEVSLVSSLSDWTPPVHEAKPESLPSHYRTTTRHGSSAHTVWEFVWEKPVERNQQIRVEIQQQED